MRRAGQVWWGGHGSEQSRAEGRCGCRGSSAGPLTAHSKHLPAFLLSEAPRSFSQGG
jgi:hypothetical protein